jgi:hypothetical protein
MGLIREPNEALLLLQHLEYGLVLVFYEYGENEPSYPPRFEYFVHYPLSTSILPRSSKSLAPQILRQTYEGLFPN